MQKLSDWGFETTMINMLRTHMRKVGDIQEMMGNASKEMENVRKIQKEIVQIKNTITEKKKHYNCNKK